MNKNTNQPRTVPSVANLQASWVRLSSNDRVSLLGHSNDELTAKDSIKLMKILTVLSRKSN